MVTRFLFIFYTLYTIHNKVFMNIIQTLCFHLYFLPYQLIFILYSLSS